MVEFFTTAQGRKIAYAHRKGAGPCVVILHGFRSDMEGSKAQALDAWAAKTGRALLRFDYSGHGQSSEAFEDGSIGNWAQDSAEIISALCPDPVVLVGSSMGGWISLLLARHMPHRIAGLVTIAAAPDFTQDRIFAQRSAEDEAHLRDHGYFYVPSDYGEPYKITATLLEDGRAQSIFDRPLSLPMPVRFLQGDRDLAVPVSKAMRLFEHAEGEDMRLTLVSGADHSFSTAPCLDLITAAILEVSE